MSRYSLNSCSFSRKERGAPINKELRYFREAHIKEMHLKHMQIAGQGGKQILFIYCYDNQ